MSKPLVTDIGHLVLQVGNMEEALRLYRDTLGFEVIQGRAAPVWTVLRIKGGELTLFRPVPEYAEKLVPLALRDGEDSPIELHVLNFEEAIDHLGKKGYKVSQKGKHGGLLIDPWGNMIKLHDHREGTPP